jgi:hypothetical protein
MSMESSLGTLATAMSLAMLTGLGNEQAQQRRAGREVCQERRQSSGRTGQECRAAGQKSNAQCRQAKQHGS